MLYFILKKIYVQLPDYFHEIPERFRFFMNQRMIGIRSRLLMGAYRMAKDMIQIQGQQSLSLICVILH